MVDVNESYETDPYRLPGDHYLGHTPMRTRPKGDAIIDVPQVQSQSIGGGLFHDRGLLLDNEVCASSPVQDVVVTDNMDDISDSSFSGHDLFGSEGKPRVIQNRLMELVIQRRWLLGAILFVILLIFIVVGISTRKSSPSDYHSTDTNNQLSIENVTASTSRATFSPSVSPSSVSTSGSASVPESTASLSPHIHSISRTTLSPSVSPTSGSTPGSASVPTLTIPSSPTVESTAVPSTNIFHSSTSSPAPSFSALETVTELRNAIEDYVFLGNASSAAIKYGYPIGSWNTSLIIDFSHLFSKPSFFNSDVSAWDVSSAGNVAEMFQGASFFSQNLCRWSRWVPATANVTGMFLGTACPNSSSPQFTQLSNGIIRRTGPWCYNCD